MRMLLTLFGPVTWLGLLIAFLWQYLRLRHERKVFHTAIDRHATGLWAMVIGGVVSALVVSGLAVGAGLILPSKVLMTLTALSLVALVLAVIGYAPWYLALAGVAAPLLQATIGPWVWCLAALVGLLWLAEGALLKVIDPPISVPTIKVGRRGADIAVYDHRQLYWLPLILPVAGDGFNALPWWPTVNIGATHFALIALPLILGVALRTKKQLPQHATAKWAVQYLIGSAAALLLAVGAWLAPQWALAWAIVLAALGIAMVIANRVALGGGSNYISQTGSGVRIVAVLPETPAEKMGLEAGDIVMLCNQQPVHQAAELYAAIQTHPTYCRLRVMRLDGQIKLCESAIFEGAPHTLGMITFAEELSR